MCIPKWDLERFRSLIDSRYGPDLLARVRVYLGTLDWKVCRANYHAQNFDECWKKLFEENVIRINSDEFLKAMDFSAYEMEAMIQSLHSLGDLLAQVSNVAILGQGCLNEGRVDLGAMIRHLSSSNTATAVCQSLGDFQSSCEFQYVTAFCNVVKHRRLIDFDYHLSAVQGGQVLQGLRFKEFEYKSVIHSMKMSNDIKEQYRDVLYCKMNEVGVLINDFLT